MEKKKRFSFIIFVIGILVLVFGLVLILLKLINIDDRMQDGEYLIARRTWFLDESVTARGDARDDATAEGDTQDDADYVTNCGGDNLEETNCLDMDVALVVWDFDEIGKGRLTTNGGLDWYDFIWAIEDNKLKIETNWLYLLENEYEYSLDQNAGRLDLTDGDKSYHFIAAKQSTDS